MDTQLETHAHTETHSGRGCALWTCVMCVLSSSSAPAEQHFSSSELTLNQRFSAPQEGAAAAAGETDELTLDQRFSSGR